MKQNPRDQPHRGREKGTSNISTHSKFRIGASTVLPPPSSLSPKQPLSHNLLPSHCAIPTPSSILHPPSSSGFLTTHISLSIPILPHLHTPPSFPPAPPVPPHLASPRRAASRPVMRVIPNPNPISIQDGPTYRIPHLPHTTPNPHDPPPLRQENKKPGPGEKKKSLLIPCAATRTQPHGRGGGDRC